ncbi:MAG TPA: ATP-dependent DNA helicase [Micromonosporaceae bacterium]
MDETQRQIVAHRRGPLLGLGGPGTGKTTVLVEAAAARVAEGTDPERLLVLTFSRRGAARLRTRIAARVAMDGRACGELSVRTFHGYAFAVLRRLAARYGEPLPRLLNGPEQDLVIRELLAHDTVGWPVSLRSALRTRGFAAELRDLLLRASERGVGPQHLAELGREHGRDDWVAAARFAREYGDVLTLRDATTFGSVGYDTAELIRVTTARLAADVDALAAERSRARFTYVDEIHDLDPAQWDLLHLIAGGGGNLVGFGDPDSSMFAFRGADPTEIWRMTERFRSASGEPAPIVALHTCWRSGPALVAAADRVVERVRGPGRHRVRRPATGTPDGAVEVRLFRSVTQEAAYLAHRLRAAHLLDGVPWSAMAVLMRSASMQLAGLRRALTQAGVPVRVAADDLPLAAQPATAPLLLLLRCALEPAGVDEEVAVALLHSPLGGADPFAERRLRQGLRGLALAAGDRRPSGVLLAEALADPAELAALDARWAAPARRVAALLATTRETVRHPEATAEQALWELWQASGLAERWAAASAAGGQRGAAADRDLDAVLALFDAAARFTDRLPGAGPRAFLEHLVGQQIPADSLAPAAETGEAVSLITVHSAKGLEWDLVAVPGVQEGRWPDLRLRGSVLGSELLVDVVSGRAVPGDRSGSLTAALDEERRLCFVAVTRARTQLIMTAIASGDGEEQPSRFLDELAAPDSGPEPASEPDTGSSPAGVPDAGPPLTLTLPALVARLRTVVADPRAGLVRRRAAARQLARLADTRVAGAHPDQWWGLRPLSDPGPLAAAGEPATVSPSMVEQARRCGLRWLLERHGGAKPPGAEQTVGSLVHAAAERVDRLTTPELYRYLDEHWGVVEVAARWEEGRKREQAEQMVQRLVRWVANNPRELVATEQPFQATLPGSDVTITGTVDRVERDAAGRLVIIDFKTGKSSPTGEEVRRHPQLGTYQLAVALGGFTGFSDVTEPGGAALVQLGRERRDGPEQHQPPLAADQDPGWAEDAVRDAASTMSGASFTARANPQCGICAVRTSCPLSEHGRQVVEPGEREHDVRELPDGADGGCR